MADGPKHSTTLTPLPPIPEGEPPEEFATLAREYPGLILLSGFALGLLAGALVRGGTVRKLARHAATLAVGAGEAGMVLGKLAMDRTESARQAGAGTFDRISRSVRRKSSTPLQDDD